MTPMTPLLKAEIFEFYVKEVAKELRRYLGERDISRMKLELVVSGDTLSGDLKVVYTLNEGYYGNNLVEGGTLNAVVVEMMRRKGWVERNAPLCLPRVSDEDARVIGEIVDDKPF